MLVARRARTRRRRSSSPAGRSRSTPDDALLAEIAEVRRVVELGRQARAGVGAQAAAAAARARRRGRAARGGLTRTRSRDELRVKEVAFGHVEAASSRQAEPARARAEARQGARRRARGAPGGRLRGARRRPLPRRRPRARARRGARRARRQGRLGGRRRRTASRSRSTRHSTTSSSARARVYELIHPVNALRKEAGLELTDRIGLTIPGGGRRSARARGLDQGRDARGRRSRRTAATTLASRRARARPV